MGRGSEIGGETNTEREREAHTHADTFTAGVARVCALDVRFDRVCVVSTPRPPARSGNSIATMGKSPPYLRATQHSLYFRSQTRELLRRSFLFLHPSSLRRLRVRLVSPLRRKWDADFSHTHTPQHALTPPPAPLIILFLSGRTRSFLLWETVSRAHHRGVPRPSPPRIRIPCSPRPRVVSVLGITPV